MNTKMYVFVIAVLSVSSCDNLYRAGNLIDLDYAVETRLKTSVIRKYIDTLIVQNGHQAPEKWASYTKVVNLDSINNKRLYFKESPEEMYLMSFQGQWILADVYNEKIRKGDWVSGNENISEDEMKRVLMRLKTEILDKIELLAKKDHLADSVIYK